ncbi:acetyl-CoA synthetase-like protein, partial [Basidiobolus meristosporus CBS 931.73]
PTALALISDEENLTYGELWNGANQLARHLIDLMVKPETLVCMLMSRSVHAFVTTIGILNSGAAYLPVDPAYPIDRIEFMLEESESKYMVTERKLYESSDRLRSLIDSFPGVVVFYDDPAWRDTVSEQELEPIANPDNLAYVIFTSGSTGKPKGVMMAHSSLRNLARCYANAFQIDDTARVLQFSSICFDATVGDWASAFSSGGALVVVNSAAHLVGSGFMDTVYRHKVTYCLIPTSMLNTFPEEEVYKLASMRALSIGAEPPNLQLMTRWKDHGFMLMNSYGPTETCVIANTTQFTGEKHYACIGKLLPNYQAFMLDNNQQVLPAGIIGEMCIAGAGLARGFINQPVLTDQLYPTVDLAGFGPVRVYRSGDVALFHDDGEVQFIGRIDFQVKIRGFRIELGEIENNIRQQSAVDVKDAVVMAQDDKMGIKRLVGYVVLEPHQKEQEHKALASKIRQELKRLVPPHMVPSHILIMQEFPVSPNGKIERKLFPNPVANISENDLNEAWSNTASESSDQKSSLQARLEKLFAQLLDLDHIGVNENFFDLGANSLLIVKAHSIIKKIDKFANFSLVHLFKYPSIHALAQHLEENSTKKPQPVERDSKDEISNLEAGNEGQSIHLDEIAIIGISCRAPGADNHEQFWENLRNGEESISFYTNEELLAAGVSPAELSNPNYVKALGAMNPESIQTFDADFFGMAPREVLVTDPQQRIFLECSWEALENAGYNSAGYTGKVGVYAGVGINHYLHNYILPQEDLVQDMGAYPVMIGNSPDFLATRVAYKLALRGPAITVQTACSTSLVAVHQAKNAIRNGECDMALAGGVSLGSLEKSGYVYREGMVASPDGHCRAFDQNSKGTVLGQGCGVVLLKSLAKAIADKDNIYAVLKGSGVNNDGSLKVGFTAPSVQMQASAITSAHQDAKVSPKDISYVETHGTGTIVGDVIELEALNDAFTNNQVAHHERYCAITSVKTNIGHTDSAAGVIGLIKVSLALYNEYIPPHLHFREPNAQVDWANSPFYVNTKLTPWKRTEGVPRIAGISSFGMGGTNAHAILSESPVSISKETSDSKLPWYLLNISAFNDWSLKENTKNLVSWVRSQQGVRWDLKDIACTLAIHRSQFPKRQALLVQNISELTSLDESGLSDRIVSTPRKNGLSTTNSLASLKEVTEKDKHTVFLLPGQGSQYISMGRDLYKHYKTFASVIDECLQY